MIQDIEDDYAEYLEDERGYAWDCWDVLAADVIHRHDDVLRSGLEQLQTLDPAGLDDLDCWAYARASLRHGDIDGFLEAGRLLLASEGEHRGLDYRGVYTAVVETLCREGATDEARLLHREMKETWPEDAEVDRLHCWIALHHDEEAARAAIAEVRETRGDDLELMFELCEDALAARRRELAAELLEQTANAAESGSAIMVDIRLLQTRLARAEAPPVTEE